MEWNGIEWNRIDRLMMENACMCIANFFPLTKRADVDAMYMQECIALARTGLGKTDPNPMVGCVIVRDGKVRGGHRCYPCALPYNIDASFSVAQVLGRGYHPKAGEPHAEIFALRDAGLDVTTTGGSDAKEWTVVGSGVQGATAYVSLEPCNHVGRVIGLESSRQCDECTERQRWMEWNGLCMCNYRTNSSLQPGSGGCGSVEGGGGHGRSRPEGKDAMRAECGGTEAGEERECVCVLSLPRRLNFSR